MTWARLIMALAMHGVPRHLRESVLGDLLEQGEGARGALAVALHFQAEPYRAGTDRRDVLLLLLAAAGVLWIVPMAAQSLLAQSAEIGGTFGRIATGLWGSPQLLAAVACGLLLGRASLLPPHADAARLHLVLIFLPVAGLAAPGALRALLAVTLLPAAAWLGHRNRQAQSPGPLPT